MGHSVRRGDLLQPQQLSLGWVGRKPLRNAERPRALDPSWTSPRRVLHQPQTLLAASRSVEIDLFQVVSKLCVHTPLHWVYN